MSSVIRSNRLLTLLAYATVYFFWGGSYLGIQIALESLPPFLISGIRFTLAGVILMAIGLQTGAAWPSWKQWRASAGLAVIMFFITNTALMQAQRLLPSGLTATLYAMVPLWFILLTWLWQRQSRPTLRMLLGVVIGFIGVAIIYDPSGVGNAPILGILLVLISSFCWSFSSLLSQRIPRPTSIPLQTGMNLLCGGLMILAASGVSGEWLRLDVSAITLRSVIAVLYLAICASVIAFSAYMWLMGVSDARRLSTYAYVNPVVALILGALFAGELLTEREWIAAAIIVIAVVLVTTAQRKEALVPAPVATAPTIMPVRERIRGFVGGIGR
jgi:drug/metabolite transporter (DMT)-like permease